jgi:hypothetical protein
VLADAGSIPAASTTKHFRIKDLRIDAVIILVYVACFGTKVAFINALKDRKSHPRVAFFIAAKPNGHESYWLPSRPAANDLKQTPEGFIELLSQKKKFPLSSCNRCPT